MSQKGLLDSFWLHASRFHPCSSICRRRERAARRPHPLRRARRAERRHPLRSAVGLCALEAGVTLSSLPSGGLEWPCSESNKTHLAGVMQGRARGGSLVVGEEEEEQVAAQIGGRDELRLPVARVRPSVPPSWCHSLTTVLFRSIRLPVFPPRRWSKCIDVGILTRRVVSAGTTTRRCSTTPPSAWCRGADAWAPSASWRLCR